MVEKLLGVDWEEESIQNEGGAGIVHHYSNDDIGHFFITPPAKIELGNYPIHAILSTISETKYDSRLYIFCKENEKIRFTRKDALLLTLEEVVKRFPDNIIEKQEKILLKLYKIDNRIGFPININIEFPSILYSESIEELRFIINLLVRKDIISGEINELDDSGYKLVEPFVIQENGWKIIEERLTHNEKNVFVAMWFDKKMDEASIAIENAIRTFYFEPIRIDRKEHNNEISGEILFEIKRSKFLVADVTGQRQGVYYEAGYAMGIGIPVIWSCHKSEIRSVHFDTRQYNHIIWENSQELNEKLINRIKGTILI